jgi:peptidoglycan hydrolase-like protein with peptidoglycan-binding domain
MIKKFLIGTFALAVLLVGSSALAYDFGTTTLKVGSKGEAVKNLQIVVGATPVDGSFGQITKAKVMAWQANNGLTADGLFGIQSKNKANNLGGAVSGNFPAGCTSAAGYSSTTGQACVALPSVPAVTGCAAGALFNSMTGAACTAVAGPLAGISGSLTSIGQLSQYSGEEVGSGSKDVKVLGFDAKASTDGDVQMTSIKLTFDSYGNGSTESDRLIDYLTTVKVLMGSTVVGTASTADFTKDSTGIFSKTISLSGVVVKANTTEKFYVSVDAVANLDSGDITADSWSVGINNVRYVDGGGVTTTDAELMVANIEYNTAGNGVGISFVSFSTAADTELKISADSSNPVSSTIKVSTTTDTNNVVLLKGKMVLEGTSNVWLDELPITLTASATSISAITGSVKLTINGKEFTESTGSNCLAEADFSTAGTCDTETTEGVLFDNLDLTLTAGSTVYFTVSADINDLESTAAQATDFREGMSLLASLTTGGRAFIVAENSQGDQLTNATEMTGAATGLAQVFRSTGLTVALINTSTAVTLGDGTTATTVSDSGTFTITFDVTASGNDVWIDSSAPTASSTLTATDLDVTGTGTLAATIQNITGGSTAPEVAGGQGFVVRDGTTQRFIVTAHILATASGYFNVALGAGGIGYALTDADGTTAYTTGLTSFKTNNLYLNDY